METIKFTFPTTRQAVSTTAQRPEDKSIGKAAQKRGNGLLGSAKIGKELVEAENFEIFFIERTKTAIYLRYYLCSNLIGGVSNAVE